MLTVKISASLEGQTQGDGEPAACRLVDVRQKCKEERLAVCFRCGGGSESGENELGSVTVN
jgi:hypothetical protein